MSEHGEPTDFQKGEIVGLKGLLLQTKIGHELGIPQQTISSFLHQVDECDSINNFQCPGRPGKTSALDDYYLVHTAESNTHIPLKDLRDQTNHDISKQTIRRRLHEAGIQKWKAVKRALLTEKHAALHFE